MLAVAQVITALGTSTLTLLWPLYIKQHFSWVDSQYSLLLVLSGLVSALILSATTTIQHALGPRSSLVIASLVAAAAATFCFLL